MAKKSFFPLAPCQLFSLTNLFSFSFFSWKEKEGLTGTGYNWTLFSFEWNNGKSGKYTIFIFSPQESREIDRFASLRNVVMQSPPTSLASKCSFCLLQNAGQELFLKMQEWIVHPFSVALAISIIMFILQHKVIDLSSVFLC